MTFAVRKSCRRPKKDTAGAVQGKSMFREQSDDPSVTHVISAIPRASDVQDKFKGMICSKRASLVTVINSICTYTEIAG